MSLSFDIDLPPTKEGDQIKIEVTENYEGDRWHLVQFKNLEFVESIGLDHWEEVAKYLREI
tara:strand:- start:139 stop:321 length:183 start_codon:yes stop_codon:yes gene_type:complete